MRTLLALAFFCSTAIAQSDFPSRPVRLVVTVPPGGAADFIARLVGGKLSESLGQPVVVQNKAGASGTIAADAVAKASPDGYTLLQNSVTTHGVGPHLFATLPYDPVKDFAPIARVFISVNLLVVHPSVPVQSVAELVALAKAKPGELTYAHTGVGSSQHLAGELFKSMAKLNIQPVAYRGTTAVLPDLLAGRINMGFANIVNVAPLVKEGKLRAFAVSSRERSALMPDLPTMIEVGFPDYEAVPWFGLMAPAGTPQPIIARLHDETVKALAVPEVRRALEGQGLIIIGGTPAEFAETIRTETPYWAKVIKEAGIKASD
jgi:tripartite-type tricarboxylate transporter receptor subunit TctC